MLNKTQLRQYLLKDREVLQRLEILKQASKKNPDFKNPHIWGGYLRDTFLNIKTNDCDVAFQGHMLNQQGITECVHEAEKILGTAHFDDWEFENVSATGVSGEMYEDCMGLYSIFTDWGSMLMLSSTGNLKIGGRRTLKCLEKRTYDIRYEGLVVWCGHRGRSYFRALTGLSCRALYLCHKLNMIPSKNTQELLRKFDFNFSKLTEQEKQDILNFWKSKTRGQNKIKETLDKYHIYKLSESTNYTPGV